MYLRTHSEPTQDRARYLQQFLELGRYYLYYLPSAREAKPPMDGYAQYDFSSDLIPRPDHRSPQTVEQIIRSGYLAVPPSQLETAVLSDKKQTSWLGLDDTIRQIRQRYQVYERNLYEIELAKCSAINTQFSVVADRGGIPSDSRESYRLNKALQKLYERQLDERVDLWKDISRLKQALPEVAQLYLGAYRKLSLLETLKGDGP